MPLCYMLGELERYTRACQRRGSVELTDSPGIRFTGCPLHSTCLV